jgi:hypothetical protein
VIAPKVPPCGVLVLVLVPDPTHEKASCNALEISTHAMTGHPCAGHACDHCFLCDVVGVCCGSVSAAERTQLEAEHREPYVGLAVAIVHEAGSFRSLSELLRADVAGRGRGVLADISRPALPAVPTTAATPNRSRKEAIRVPLPRTTR